MIASRILQLSKDSIIYGLGSALTSFIGIFLVPILTRVLIPEEYGVLDLLVTVVFLSNVVFALGFDSASGILFFESEDEVRRESILSTSLIMVVGFSVIVLLALFPFARPLAQILFHSTQYVHALRYTMIAIPFLLTLGFAVAALRYRFARGKYLLAILTNVVLTIVLTILFIVPLRKGISGYFLAWLLTGIGSAVVALVLARKSFGLHFSRTHLRELLRIGVPLIPAGLAGWSLSLIDRFFLSGYSLETLGWYSLGVKLSSILGLGIAAMQLAWGPFALSLAKDPDAKETYAKTLTLFTVAAGFVALAITAFAPEVLSIISSNAFAPAARVVGILSLGLIAYGSYTIVAIGASIAKKTVHIAWTTGTAAAVNIGLNFLLIPRYGMTGAAIATLVAYIISVCSLYFISQRFYLIPFETKKVVITWVVLLVAVVGFALMPYTVTPSLIVIKVGILAAFLFSVIAFRVLERGELAAIRNAVYGMLSRLRK